MQKKNFLGIDPRHSAYETSRTTIIPVPFEATTSYITGTKNGPAAIIEASAYVELYDEELDGQVYKTGIHTDSDVQQSSDGQTSFARITERFKKALDDGKFPVGLGGEHSISFPAYRAFHDRFDKLSVLQLDAHSDLRDQYEGTKYSHASVMRRIYELNPSIVQVGIRSQCIEEAEFIKRHNISTFYAHQIYEKGFDEAIIGRLKPNVYVTIDVDFFDPAIMPATGTPEPGGFHWQQSLSFLKDVFCRRNVVGFDVVELSPIKGLVHPDFFVAKLIYKLLGYKFLETRHGAAQE